MRAFVGIALAIQLFVATSTAVAADKLFPPPAPDATDNDPPIAFTAILVPWEETSRVDSRATGRAEFIMSRKDLKLTWKIDVKDTTSKVTAVRLHGAARPAQTAGPVIDLAPKGVKFPLEGSVILDELQMGYFVTGRVYVNVFTEKYKDGEIRGQVERHAAR